MFNTAVPQYEMFLSVKYRSVITRQYRRDGWHVTGPCSSLSSPVVSWSRQTGSDLRQYCYCTKLYSSSWVFN